METNYSEGDRSFSFYFCNLCHEFFDTTDTLEAHRINVHNYVDIQERPSARINATCAQMEGNPKSYVICQKKSTPIGEIFPRNVEETSTRSYKCTLCKKSFSTIEHLIAHSKIHPPEKSYKCDQCDKCFVREHSLVTHKRIHTGEKPFKCNFCDMRFSQRLYFVRHKCKQSGKLK